MKSLLTITLLVLSFAVTGCAARSAEMYRDDTRTLLDQKTSAMSDCYNTELQSDRTAVGKVVVRFKVEADSGKIVDAKVDETQSSGSKALGHCVVTAIEGLVLDPPDERDGDATFTWEFQAKN